MASEATKTMKKVEKAKQNNNKPKKKKKGSGNIFSSIGRYCKDVGTELKRVTWPTRKQLLSATGAVIAFTAVMAIFVGLLDLGLMNLLKLLYR